MSKPLETWTAMRERHYEERSALIRKALEQAGTMKGAARLIGLNIGQLYRETEARGISRPSEQVKL